MVITPAILETDAEELKRKVGLIEGHADLIQIDVGDGQFVPTVTVLPRALGEFRPLTAFEVHLMVKRPDRFVADWVHLGASKVIFHVEAEGDLEHVIAQCRELDCDVGIAINPGTSADALQPYLDLVDEALFLTIQPGAQGNPFLPDVVKEIDAFHKTMPGMPIAVDGGVSAENLASLRAAGVQRACVGSTLWKSADPVVMVEKLSQF
jgi:ribulose-phosphate 3-epimerase